MNQSRHPEVGVPNKAPEKSGLSWSAPTPARAPIAEQPKARASLAQNNVSNAAKYAGFIVVGAVLGVLLAWGWNAWRAPAEGETQNGSQTASPGAAPAAPGEGSDPSLAVMTPQRAGLSVEIDKALVSAPTWLVVYEEGRDGKPGNALGAALFLPDRQRGNVTLLRATMPGRTYLVGRRVDDGDRKFSLVKDLPLYDGGEEAALAQFAAN